MGSIKGLGPIVKGELIFREEDYGKPINEKLSEILRRNTSKNDFANIAIQSNVSFSTIRDVVYRTNSLTKLNANAISLLIHAAYENSFAYKLQAEGDILYLGNLLKI
ncbi:hypothetical protein Murru_1419 [Allomuricauda ruestringensis DSM 13258]|uniref:Uncharacterized protein n=1 Tax=Allomuricauda ruestringensis (strain DSM 13258 / CIP 107369 / LMG 19739 / B1) TaxID=886377 RepID=G2PPS9_ALLRU|nr:hypothetical protein [Allomuricauda ruestringensis]AEM70460.1 hypothetical protein Murru_1419 [Allomuricauda ruestringensis DSM 13258]